MKSSLLFLLPAFILTVTGCGGGGGGGGPAPVTSQADQNLIASIIGTWKLSQASKSGVWFRYCP